MTGPIKSAAVTDPYNRTAQASYQPYSRVRDNAIAEEGIRNNSNGGILRYSPDSIEVVPDTGFYKFYSSGYLASLSLRTSNPSSYVHHSTSSISAVATDLPIFPEQICRNEMIFALFMKLSPSAYWIGSDIIYNQEYVINSIRSAIYMGYIKLTFRDVNDYYTQMAYIPILTTNIPGGDEINYNFHICQSPNNASSIEQTKQARISVKKSAAGTSMTIKFTKYSTAPELNITGAQLFIL